MLRKPQFFTLIRQGDFKELFVSELGWNRYRGYAQLPPILVDDKEYTISAIAERSGFQILYSEVDEIPTQSVAKKIDTKLRRQALDYICIYRLRGTAHDLWVVPVRTNEKRDLVLVEYDNANAEVLYQKIDGITFELDEETNIVDLRSKVQTAFAVNSEKITKDFYAGFKKQHKLFADFIKGIDDKIETAKNRNKQWYASVMLNRLMFCYFIQKKGFLDLDVDYLRNKLNYVRANEGEDKFYNFYRSFLRRLFHDGLNTPKHSRDFEAVFGKIPYLNGGMFDEHQLEADYADIDIPDEAFIGLFDFFDKWNWHLDTRLTASGRDINPDVLGYIFEQYINDRAQMGAYYTKEDITEYIGRNCILPYLFDQVKSDTADSAKAFASDGYVWRALRDSGDRYIFDAVKKGYANFGQIPENIARGIITEDMRQEYSETPVGELPDNHIPLAELRADWNSRTPEPWGLPNEIWRETIERLQRCDDILGKIRRGEITSINDFITYNLDIRTFAADIIAHYTAACENNADVIQKAMIVCSKREIGYRLLKKFMQLKPEWFDEHKHPEDLEVPEKKLKDLTPMPTIAMVATRGKNDPKDMYEYLGDKKRIKSLEDAFKMEYSNLRIVIVVDMWITGFDVPCLTYLYNDKPIQKHTLVQTVSRVNRKYPGKKFGYIVDYIGIHGNMMEAMKQYGGDTFGPSEDDVKQALSALIVELEIIKQLFVGFDLRPFTDKDAKPLDRLECLQNAAEHILTLSKMYNVAKEGAKPKEVDAKTFFLAHIKRLKAAYDICQPSNALTHEQLALSQCFMCVASYIRKASGVKHDTESMNRAVERMVAEALQCNSVVSILDSDVEESIFSPEFIEQLNRVKLPATRLEVLIKMLRRSIAQYKNTNKLAAEKFEEMLQKTLDEYHNRRTKLSSEEASAAQRDAVDEIIRNATQQALDLLNKLGEDKDSFRSLGLTFEEKAFYDILMHLRDTHNFEYGEDKKVGSFIINEKCKALAKKVKELIDTKSSFADWLTNGNVRAELNQDLFFLLNENGYPPEWNDEVFDQVLDQVENYKQNN